jgi:hypothetical protein
MDAFRQHAQQKNAWFALFGGLFFLGLALDAEFFNIGVPAGLREDGPWMFWSLVILGSVAAISAAWQLVSPPLVLAADSRGITLGSSHPSLEINLSPRNFGFKRRNERSRVVPWDQIQAIGVGEVRYTRNGHDRFESALRIEFREAVDVANADDLHAIQAGTPAYFAAAAR